MTTPSRNHDWLAQTTEDALEPALPICDPHHHLWDQQPARVAPRYLLDEILDDVRGGHNVVSTVFIECGAMFKPTGPEALRPVGETEFVNGVAAMSASGLYGPSRIAAGIIGTADLRLGEAVGAVLDAQIAAGGGRFRGIRRAAAWDPDPGVPNHRTEPGARLFFRDDFRAGFAQLARRQLTFEAWCYHPQIPGRHRARARVPRHHDHPQPLRRTARRRRLRGQGEGRLRGVAHVDRGAGDVPERRREARRHQHGDERLRLARALAAALEPGARRRHAALLRRHHRAVRRRPVHVRVELPRRQGELQLHGAVELVQAADVRRVGGGEGGSSSTTRRRACIGSGANYSRPNTRAALP